MLFTTQKTGAAGAAGVMLTCLATQSIRPGVDLKPQHETNWGLNLSILDLGRVLHPATVG